MTPQIEKEARRHALGAYPEESCGIVVAGVYHPCKNTHETPRENFRIDSNEWRSIADGRPIEMVIHSHPDGELSPSKADMIAQASWAVPFAIIKTDGLLTSEPLVFGDETEIAPLIGRPFIHGVFDCYSLIRDTYRFGRERLAADGVTEDWPYDPIVLPDFPRDDGWWDPATGEDLYVENFGKAGFVQIPANQARAGDVCLIKLLCDKLSHGGLLVRNDLLLHHLPKRVSRREGAGLWARQASLWLRYSPEDTNA